MNITTENLATGIILKPVGRIDQNSAMQFQETLLDAISSQKSGGVAIDMSGVEFLSSIGLRALMIGFKHSKSLGGKLALYDFTSIVREVFAISRFDTMLNCFDAREPALASLET